MSHGERPRPTEKIARYNATLMKYVAGGMTVPRKRHTEIKLYGRIKKKKRRKKGLYDRMYISGDSLSVLAIV